MFGAPPISDGKCELARLSPRKRASTRRIYHAVRAMMKELGLAQGSVVARANPYAAYNLYELLQTYIYDPEARLKIHAIIEESRAQRP